MCFCKFRKQNRIARTDFKIIVNKICSLVQDYWFFFYHSYRYGKFGNARRMLKYVTAHSDAQNMRTRVCVAHSLYPRFCGS